MKVGGDKTFVFRVHAVRRMFERRISKDDVKNAVELGEVISDYPDDKPYPSKLMLWSVGGRIIHVVVAHNTNQNEYIIITAYVPSLDIWKPGFKRRR